MLWAEAGNALLAAAVALALVHLCTAATDPLTTMMTGVINARMNVREPTNADGQVCSETLRPSSFLAQGT